MSPAAATARSFLQSLRRHLARKAVDCSGAVTIDWVVLSAVVLALGVGVVSVLSDGVNAVGNATSQTLSDATMKDITFN